MKMSIRSKLIAGFSGLTGTLVIFGILSWLYIGWLGENVSEIVDWKVPAVKLSVDVHAGAYNATIEQLNYLLYQKPEAHQRAKAVLKKMTSDLAEINVIGQQYNDKKLLQQSASVQQDVNNFSQLYERGVQGLVDNKQAIKVMIAKGKSVLAEADSFALKQEVEYADLRKNGAPQAILNEKVQKYILVNQIKSQAYTIIQHEKQERLFKNRHYYAQMQEELPALMEIFNALQKITQDNTELKKINVAREATKGYAEAASQWIKNDTELKLIVEEMNAIAKQARQSATDAENNGWIKAAEVGDKTASLVSQANLIILVTLFVATTIGIALSIFIPKNIANAINRLKNVIFNVEKNNDLTLRGDVSSNDEISEMAQAFNKMLQAFQTAISEVTDASVQIAAASEETSAITEQTLKAIQTQQQETAQVSVAMNEMTTTVSEIASNINQTSVASNEASEQANNGRQAMQQTIDSVSSLESIIQGASGTILKLEQQSNNITSVLDVINSIADQTNLLALNAAIEAARAGEHGRGFSVVADEVRNLAGRTQGSIIEITKIIEQLQDGSRKAVQNMMQSESQTTNANEQAEATGEALTSIAEVIIQINEMCSQIAAASEEQGVTAEEINRNIIQISDMTDKTEEGAAQTSEASKDLARLASGLNTLVQRFTV
jgi:methyl-accepting chemotaxis protein